MSQRVSRALGGFISTAVISATTIAVAIALLSVAPAPSSGMVSAAPAEARTAGPAPSTIHVTAKASGPNHFNSKIDVNLPAGGNAIVTSPSLDPNMTAATVTYTPLSAYQGFEQLAFHLMQAPTPGK